MFHLALYSSSIGPSAALAQVTQVADPVIAPAGNGFLVGVLSKLMRVAGVGTDLTRAQLNSASLRDFAPFDVNPVNVGTAIESPARLCRFDDNPIPLAVNEELDAFAVQSNVGAQLARVAVWFADMPVRPFTGRMFTVRWTNATALVANAWTAFTPTLDNGIPSGSFAIVGARAISAGGLFFRFIPRGGTPNRPGGFAYQTQDGASFDGQRYGEMGEWMRFTNTTIPSIEMFSGLADATQQGYLDLVQVG